MSRRKSTTGATDKLGEQKKLRLFVRRVEELGQTSFAQKELELKLRFHWKNDQGLSVQFDQPNEDGLRSFLLGFRQFTLKDEPVNMDHIYNLCQRELTDDEAKQYLRECRDGWKEALRKSGFEFVLNGKEISPEYAAHIWINGYYFHNDADLQEALDKLLPPDAALVRYQFLTFVAVTTQYLCCMRDVVIRGLEEGWFGSETRENGSDDPGRHNQ